MLNRRFVRQRKPSHAAALPGSPAFHAHRHHHYAHLNNNKTVSRLLLYPKVVVGVLICGYTVWFFSQPSITLFENFPTLSRSCRTRIRHCLKTGYVIGTQQQQQQPCTPQQYLPLPWVTDDARAAARRNQHHDEHDTPLVCVVVTTYNVEPYVTTAMDSILHQSYQNFEIIAVDDASTDRTSLEIQKYAAADDSRVKLVQLQHNTNGGAGQPTNIGMESCSNGSEFIMLVDGDDYMELDAMAVMVEHAIRFDSDVVMADFDLFEMNKGNDSSPSFTPAYDHKGKWDKIHKDLAFNILTHPRVLQTSAVPWRKLYRRSFLNTNNLQFPEGDYFFEDNAFHCNVLLHAARVSKIDRVLFHHRQQRKGQTSTALHPLSSSTKDKPMSVEEDAKWQNISAAARLGGFLPNMFQTGKLVASAGSRQYGMDRPCTPDAVKGVTELVDEWIAEKGKMIVKGQTSKWMHDKFDRLSNQTNHLEQRREYHCDLSLILPTYNNADLLQNQLKSMYTTLEARSNFTFEVLAMDEGSSDGTVVILRKFAEQHVNFYLLSSSSTLGNTKRMGMGRASNRAIPLVEGRFVYVVNVNDAHDFLALADAVESATERNVDLLVLPYQVEHTSPSSNDRTINGMGEKDEAIWTEWRQHVGEREDEKKLALQLENHPSNQLTSSHVLRDADVYFGPTRVGSAIQFHWTSIAAAHTIQFHDKVVRTHRENNKLAKEKHADVVAVLDALGLTQRALARQGALEEGTGGDSRSTFMLWRDYVSNELRRASDRVPNDLMPEFKTRMDRLLSTLSDLERGAEPSTTLRTWPYWGERFSSLPSR